MKLKTPKIPKIKLNKNEKRLLVVLSLFLLVGMFYYFVYQKQVADLADLQVQKNTKNEELVGLMTRVNQKNEYNSSMLEYKKVIKELAPKFYGDLTQEEFILIINDLASKAELEVLSYSLNENSQNLDEFLTTLIGNNEASQEQKDNMMASLSVSPDFFVDTIESRSANIDFKGDYQKMREFLMILNKNEKHITIDTINMVADEKENLSGTISINAFNVPSLDDVVSKYNVNEYFEKPSTHQIYENMFEPYQYYKDKLKEIAAKNKATVNPPEQAQGILPPYVESPKLPDAPISLPEVENFHSLNSFDNCANSYFVPNSPEITGSIAESSTSQVGGAVRMKYQFRDFNRINQASLVFAEKTVMQYDPVTNIVLDVKNEIPNNNTLMLTLVAADGKRYELNFEEKESINDWKKMGVIIPADIKYPFMIKRIYVQSEIGGGQQKLEGSLLFDQLGTVE